MKWKDGDDMAVYPGKRHGQRGDEVLPRRRPRSWAAFVCVGALLAASPALAGAGRTVHVSNYGVDADGCGTKEAPCRSIGRALLEAEPGDEVLVGPGFYGDLDRDTVLGGPGEEPSHAMDAAPCDCMIRVDERVRLRSRDGAAATVIRAVQVANAVVVEAAGAAFGVRNGGFLVTGVPIDGIAGVSVEAEAEGASVSGNVVVGNPIGILSAADGVRIEDNRTIGGFAGIAASGSGATLRRNSALDGERGFELSGQGHLFSGNVAVGNEIGVRVLGDASRVEASSVIANRSAGIVVAGAGNSLARCNVFGNGTDPGLPPGSERCGLANSSGGELRAEHVFWGSGAGPGDPPADRVCDTVAGSTTDTSPASAKALPVGLRPIR